MAAKIRIMTYNAHSCIGSDGIISPYRIADIIARYSPDIVALQELDANRARTNHAHQAREIAKYLEMDFHFHAAMEVEEEKYGIAILSRLPSRLVRAGPLPTFRWISLESRGALWASVDIGGADLQIINTHLGLHWRERRLQAEALLGCDWASHSGCAQPFVICGDMNTLPFSSVYRRFSKALSDVQLSIKGAKPLSTYPSRLPFARIDHIFASPGLCVERVDVPRTHRTAEASDHLPLIADLTVM